MKATTRNALAGVIQEKLTVCQKELDQFSDRFAKNPAYAFEWSPLEAAAAQSTLNPILVACTTDLSEDETEEQAFERIREYIEYNALSHADRVNRSTSTSANSISDYERRTWVRLMQVANGRPLASL